MDPVKSYVDDSDVQKHRWWILTAVGMFTFMSTLDGSIVNIALPVMSRDLRVPLNQVEWVVSIYLIIICALLLLFGKIGDSFGKIKVFRWGTSLFILGSLLAGFNHSLWFLLFARVVQATGASMTMSTNNGIITEIFPMNERGKALGLIGSFVSLGSIAGPGIGGVILAHLPWGYIFWINVPVGILTMIMGHFMLPKDRFFNKVKIDVPGSFTFGLTIVLFFLGVFLGQEIGFSNWIIIALWVFSLIGLWRFIHVERHTEQPLLPFHIFKNKNFTISLLTAMLIFIVNFFFNVIGPFYLENARGLEPNYAGYILMIFPIVQVVIAPLAGSISDKIGPYLLTVIGLIAILISQIGYAMTQLTSPLWFFMAMIGVVGLGNGIFQAPNNTIVMSTVETQDLGIAGGLNALARNMGMIIGISLSTTILFAAMSHKAGHHVTTYLTHRPDIFIYGMHMVFIISSVICLLTAIVTINRWRQSSRNLTK
ncbi:MFS transporter [Lactobacillus sp. CC-MHH1034]|uniref:MFS transporter n=1 Tax=Agrilactobacillus fermenti TaxID=2586909 RepID=UPI001E36315C|nr:MFS transporter [Agrilactobacillus fermenti]MCD2255301.1 MFS transporter [Agrilactobacillus fermenti]